MTITTAPGAPFHRLARNHAHHWWRPLVGTLYAGVVWLVLISLVVLLGDGVAALAGQPDGVGGTASFGPLGDVAVLCLALATLIPVTVTAARWIQRRHAGGLSSVTGCRRPSASRGTVTPSECDPGGMRGRVAPMVHGGVMAELKTVRTDASVDEFLAAITDERRRRDAVAVRDLMASVTGEPGAMWGAGIVGFGNRTLTYASGRTLDWFTVGFSPRKQSTTLYLTDGFDGYEEALQRLGPHSIGKSCLYVKRLDDVDTAVLGELISAAVQAHTTS
jgi:hypothetical protein